MPPSSLPYASTPPSDRAHLTPGPDGFVLTLPPYLSWRFAIPAALAVLVGVFMFLGAILPFSNLPAPWRVLYAGLALVVLYTVADQFAHRQSWAVLTVRGHALTLTSPRLFRTAERRYSLTEYKEATTRSHENRGDLTLVRHDGTEEILLDSRLYRPRDLDFAATSLRAATSTPPLTAA